MATINEQLHNSATHAKGNDPSCPVCIADTITAIAEKHLGIKTLTTRNSDSLDFYDAAVWNIKAALEAAFAAGQQKAAKESR